MYEMEICEKCYEQHESLKQIIQDAIDTPWWNAEQRRRFIEGKKHKCKSEVAAVNYVD